MREREAEDKRHIDQLLHTRKEAATATRITLKLSEYSEKLKASLPDCLTPQTKREFLDIYGAQVAAARGKYKFCCFADMTLYSDDFDEEFEAAFTEALKDLEKQHPEITLLDLMDYSNVLPEDHPLARLINETKKHQRALRAAKQLQSSTKHSFTTIEQTSA